MKQHEILKEIDDIAVKHSSLFSDYMECEPREDDKLYYEMIALEKRAKELMTLLN